MKIIYPSSHGKFVEFLRQAPQPQTCSAFCLLALGTTSSSTTKSLLETQKLRPHPDPENQNQHFEQDHQMTCVHIKEQLSTHVFNAV